MYHIHVLKNFQNICVYVVLCLKPSVTTLQHPVNSTRVYKPLGYSWSGNFCNSLLQIFTITLSFKHIHQFTIFNSFLSLKSVLEMHKCNFTNLKITYMARHWKKTHHGCTRFLSVALMPRGSSFTDTVKSAWQNKKELTCNYRSYL